MAYGVNNTCTTDATSPEWFGLIYGSTQLLFLLIAAIIGFNHFSHAYEYNSCTNAIKLWFKAVYNKRSCYYPVFTHIFDQASDYIVVCEFYFLWKEEEKHGREYCNGLDMKAMFFSSILILLLYRVLTSIFIFKYTHSFMKILLQWLDLEFVVVIWLNWKRRRSSPNTIQRWLQSFEATFEAAPQALLQFMFLLRTDEFSTNYIVLASFLFSMISLTSRITNDEKYLFIPHAQSANFSHKRCCRMVLPYAEIEYYQASSGKCSNILNCCKFCRCDWAKKKAKANENESDSRIYKPGRMYDDERKLEDRIEAALQLKSKGYFCFVSLPYIIRCIYRLCDVSSHMFIYSLLWLVTGAVPMIALLALDFVIILILILKYKTNDLLLGMIATRFTRDPHYASIYSLFNVYRFMVHLLCLLYVTIVGYSNIDCAKCIQDEVKTQYFDTAHSTIIGVVIYGWCSFTLSLIIFIAFHVNLYVFVEASTSNDRTIETMMKSGDIDGILDAISYGYKIENEQHVIQQALYYIKFDKEGSWYKNIVSDKRIHPHMNVLLHNPFIKQKVIDAIKSSPGTIDALNTLGISINQQNTSVVAFNVESLLGGHEYLKLFADHSQKEFTPENIMFLVSVARYQEYVSSKLDTKKVKEIIPETTKIDGVHIKSEDIITVKSKTNTTKLRVPWDYNLENKPANVKSVYHYACVIYDTYIGSGAEFELNLPFETRKKLKERIKDREEDSLKEDWNNNEGMSVFDEAAHEMIALCKHTFSRYQKNIKVDKVLGRKLNLRDNASETNLTANIQRSLDKDRIV